ncbi:MAG TPA: ribosome small subunit-dependent GTPase A [Rectinemataceae bacterium]|nr:ribosome small subunit-dependent GTPase A [Rectinemataceae bacterium]
MRNLFVGFEEDPLKIEALRAFGFDEGFLSDFQNAARPGDSPARIVEVQRGRFTAVRSSEGGVEEVEIQPTGALLDETRAGEAYPAVGDWVVISDEEPARVRSVLPRRNALARKRPGETARDRVEAQILAANVDFAFIVMAAGRDWNPRRLERYLALAGEAGVRPVVVITKADLADDPDALVEDAVSLAPGLQCALVCAPEGRGLESLGEWLQAGKTIVLLGSSGAGKSTLLNAVAGHRLADTGDVRSGDERGRHTTTHRQLYRLPGGALVIDSPGLREIQLWGEEDSVDSVFGEIERYAAECRYRDCAHLHEPGCAVRAALESGEIDSERYESWRKLRREVAYLNYREDPSARRAEIGRWKSINKSMRGYTKERRSLAGKARD